MSYKKKSSSVLGNAIQRISGMRSIALNLDLANGLTVENYQSKIDELEEVLSTYNTHLSLADELKAEISAKEKVLIDFSERMLAGVASKYGKDSNQYQMAGGTRKSLRKRKSKGVQ